MDYKIKDDIILIREFFKLTQDELAYELNVDKITISRTESGITYPREEFMDKFYSYCFLKGLMINIQKEMLFKDDVQRDHLLLTHASKSGIEGEISHLKARSNNDFGQGFYCGENYDSAISFVFRFPKSCVYFIEFDPSELKHLKYDVNTDWMLTIAYFRGRLDKYNDSLIVKELVKRLEGIDYIIAPIADNRMFQIIDSFIDGEITDIQCEHCLSATNLGMQYVLLTDRAISKIKVLEKCFISSKEKEYYQKNHVEIQKIGNDKTKIARIEYRDKGKYIGEILS